ncbi:putative monovalent cation/H+ antiporter subunit A [Aureimonas fodinaquatilis]|uniref:Putative monovalent cation/H+ antiporter subunit A n=1 Tax=Aureimonas fodinaquatilis TaxID=2565783 RepID=A0A5B0E0G3_9HYPH|nr:putative monovalent cation/H+ antiporter subunit A [Aureimonas fodinaquatilis]KAA0972303.1 putative monovalent cation/H+ antiporter subunit A [Aureimonas fodinaquatilis]
MRGHYEQLFYLAVALPFLASMVASPAQRYLKQYSSFILALFPIAAFTLIFSVSAQIQAHEAIVFGFNWVPSLDVAFSFRLDGLSYVFALLILGIGALIILYSGGYMYKSDKIGRFYAFLFLFMGAMLGLVLADDLMTLFIFWELTSITSFMLIGFQHERELARRGAIQALVITGMGALALLAGFIMIRQSTGFTTLSQLIAQPEAIIEGGLYVPILLCVLLGAFTKSAQMPFHVWLPNAMEAPTPVSAYLHSATMVKAGIYLLMRLFPALGDTVLWEALLVPFGSVTLVIGALLALRQSDVKLILAYTTVGSLGLLVLLIGIGTDIALEAAVLYVVAHSLAKACLFMVAGSVDHGAGTRDIRALGGLARTMPFTFAAALLGAAAIGGLPPLFGFLAKEEIYAAAVGAGSAPYMAAMILITLVGNTLMFATVLIVALKPFIGQLPSGLRRAHETSLMVWLPALVLGAVGLAAGVFPFLIHQYISNPMASVTLNKTIELTVALGFHIGAPLGLSIVTVLAGIMIFRKSKESRARVAGWLTAIGWGPDRGFDQFMRGLIIFSAGLTNFLQPGRLDYYMRTTFLVIIGVLWVTMIATGGLPSLPEWPMLYFYEWMLLFILVLGVVVVAIAPNRLTAMLSLGIQGLAVALLFLLLGAPDLSFTQFMVEILSVAILALVMTRLRLQPADRRPWREVTPEFALAALGGIGLALFLITVTQTELNTDLSDFYVKYAYVIAHGRNIVNVILVDFRAVDTMGEIAVVLTTGAAILALVRIRVSKKDRHGVKKKKRAASEVQS